MNKFKFFALLLFLSGQSMAQKSLYQSEKIFVHTDKEAYMPGDTVWFKVYTFDATSHHSSELSNVAYILLADQKNTLQKQAIVKLNNGVGNAQIVLPRTFAAGYYNMIAYTTLMRNFGEEYFFEKNIKIGNSLPLVLKNEQVDGITFFPEGGNFVENLNCRMAFKVKSKLKIPKTFEGKIEDAKGKLITTFYLDFQGIGAFSIKPEAGEEYFAVFTIAGKIYKEKLPKAEPLGYLLSTDNVVLNNGILVDVHTNINEPKKLKIVARQRGQVLVELPFETQSSVYKFVLQNDLIPETGVVQILVVDLESVAICERLVYYQKENAIVPNFKNFKASVLPRGKMEFELKLSDSNDFPLANSNFSLAITDVTMALAAPKKASSLASYLVFDEDFSDKIPYLDTLFSFQPTVSKFFIDNLMMTLKWEKTSSIPDFVVEKELQITGQAKTQNKTLNMFFSDTYGYSFKAVNVDNQGKFVVKGNWTDSVKVIVRDSNGMDIDLEIDSLYLPKGIKIAKLVSKVMPQKTLPAKPAVGSIQLKEVVIQGQKNRDLKNDFRRRLYNWEPDFELKVTSEMLKDSLGGIVFLEKNISGFSFNSTENKSVVMVDGKWVPKEMLNLISSKDIVQVDLVNKPEKLKKFGQDTQSLVNVLTQKGKDLETIFKQNKHETWLGFSAAKQISLPKYDQKYINKGPDRRVTLYWNPNLKTDKTGKANIKFFNSDFSKKYLITLYGTDGKGKIVSYKGLLK